MAKEKQKQKKNERMEDDEEEEWKNWNSIKHQGYWGHITYEFHVIHTRARAKNKRKYENEMQRTIYHTSIKFGTRPTLSGATVNGIGLQYLTGDSNHNWMKEQTKRVRNLTLDADWFMAYIFAACTLDLVRSKHSTRERLTVLCPSKYEKKKDSYNINIKHQ